MLARHSTESGKRKRTEPHEDLGLTFSVEVASPYETNCSKSKICADTVPEPYARSCLEDTIKSSPKARKRRAEGEDDGGTASDDSLILSLARHAFQKLSQKQNALWKPTPIQLQSWPILVKSSLNLTAIASTGSGKTLAYTIPLVHSCLKHTRSKTSQDGDSSSLSHAYVHGLVMLPTRELVIQVSKVMKIVGKVGHKLSSKKSKDAVNIVSLAIYGGVDKQEQINSLLQKRESGGTCTAYLIAATPMRLIDLLALNVGVEKEQDQGGGIATISPDVAKLRTLFKAVRFLVLDEADRLAIQTDLSQQIDSIVHFLRSTSTCLDKTCLFTATLPERAISKCNEWVRVPRVTAKVDSVTVGTSQVKSSPRGSDNGEENSTEDKNGGSEEKPEKKPRSGQLDLSSIPRHITQILHVCANHKKPKKLLGTIKKIRDGEKKISNRRRKGLIIIFFGRIKTLQYIHQLLQKENVKGVQLHSQMNQQKREMQLNSFKSGKTPILFATDVAARGLHCNNVEYIINYDFPGSLEQYVHRCGRAGRNKISSGENLGGNALNATVYSFFHRELSPMAKDMVDLLRSCNAWVDPNLLSLVPGGNTEGTVQSRSQRRRRNKKEALSNLRNETKKDLDEDLVAGDSEEDEFASLNQNRIVLKRASHVSSDSDSDEDED